VRFILSAARHAVTSAAGATCAANFNDGASLTLLAVPAAGSQFVSWIEGGLVVSTNPSYGFTVSASRNLVARFEDLLDELFEDRFEVE